jgi:hypothetical protein
MLVGLLANVGDLLFRRLLEEAYPFFRGGVCVLLVLDGLSGVPVEDILPSSIFFFKVQG